MQRCGLERAQQLRGGQHVIAQERRFVASAAAPRCLRDRRPTAEQYLLQPLAEWTERIGRNGAAATSRRDRTSSGAAQVGCLQLVEPQVDPARPGRRQLEGCISPPTYGA